MPGAIASTLGSIPLIGPLLGGIASIFDPGAPAQAQQGAQQAQQAAGSPQLGQLAGLLGQLGQQGGGDALGPLSAALPALLSGGAVGAGDKGGLGQQVGASTAGAFLASQLARAAERPDPQAQAGLAELGRRAAQDPIMQNAEQVARQTVQTIKDQLGPELAQIKQQAQQQALQVQATAEHRDIVARETFRREVLTRLARLEQQQTRAGVNRRF